MPAQKKPAQTKGTRKASEPTPVKEVLNGKKAAIKASKKVAQKKKPAKKAEPKFTQAQFEKRFYAMSPDEFKALCDVWNEKNLKIKLPKHVDYDTALNYFKTIPASHIRILVKTGQDVLNAEAYSALRMWHDIISNPQRIAKIHQSGLHSAKGKDGDGIVAAALKNDRLGVLYATRDKLAEKLEKGAGARDTAALARELTEVMTQIADYEKRQGPKKTTMLGQLLEGTPGSEVRGATTNKSAKGGKGSRKTSYAARVTIKDIEENDD